MELVTAWLFLSFVVERLTDVTINLLPFFKKLDIVEVDIEKVIALIYALLITLGANIDLFAMFEIQYELPYVGAILSAILMMGGSNLIHDIVSWINSNK